MEPFDNIVKAQALFRKMMACDTPEGFKKVFAGSIPKYALDEFYPVVVRAEMAAAIALCHREKQHCANFDFVSFLYEGFGLKPQHYLECVTQVVADIMERDIDAVEGIFREFDFIVENGMVAAHPASGHDSTVLDFNQARLKKRAGHAA